MKRKCTKTVDLSNAQLPPIWNFSDNKKQTVNFDGNGVASSGNKRFIANQITSVVDQAQETIALCSFLLADDEIENALLIAADRGVRVYLLLASENRLENDAEDDFSKMCQDQHKASLKKLATKVFVRSAPHFHGKFVLADFNLPSARGLLLTANITKEAIERNEEMAVRTDYAETKLLSQLFRYVFWEQAEHQMLNSRDFESVKPLSQLQLPTDFKNPTTNASILATTKESTSLKNACLNTINNATESLVVSSFGWDEDHEVIDSLCQQAQRGIQVTVLTRRRLSSMPALIKLAKSGIQVIGFNWLHAKVILADDAQCIVMSANFQKDGMDTGFETGVLLTDNRINGVREILNGWIQNSDSVLQVNTHLGDVYGKIEAWENKKFIELDIKKNSTENLEPLTAESVHLMTDERDLPSANWKQVQSHKVNYKWEVKAPVLPKNAKEIYENGDQIKKDKKATPKSFSPPVFQYQGKKLVVISVEGELASAIKQMEKQNCSAIVMRG